jgi:predicted Zn-dependent protease
MSFRPIIFVLSALAFLQIKGLAFDGRDYRIEPPLKSLAEIEAAIKERPKDPSAYCERAQANLCAGECEAAVDDFSKAIKLDPNCARAFVGRSKAYEMMGKTNLAALDIDTAVKLAAKLPAKSEDRKCVADIYRQQITILRNQGKVVQALPFFDKLILSENLGVGPHDRSELRQERAAIYLTLKLPQKAIDDINVDSDNKARHLDRYFTLAKAYEQLHKPEMVLDSYSRGIARGEALRAKKSFPDRQLAALYAARAKLYDDMGKPGLAKADRSNIGKTDYSSVYEDLYPGKRK